MQDVPRIFNTFWYPPDRNINDVRLEQECTCQNVPAATNALGAPAVTTSRTCDGKTYEKCKTSLLQARLWVFLAMGTSMTCDGHSNDNFKTSPLKSLLWVSHRDGNINLEHEDTTRRMTKACKCSQSCLSHPGITTPYIQIQISGRISGNGQDSEVPVVRFPCERSIAPSSMQSQRENEANRYTTSTPMYSRCWSLQTNRSHASQSNLMQAIVNQWKHIQANTPTQSTSNTDANKLI